MAKLAEQIKQLKHIKPRQEWVVLAKSEIFAGHSSVIPAKAGIQNKSANSGFRVKPGMTSWFFGIFAPRRLAYSFATLIFIIVGLVGFAQHTMPGDLFFPVRKIAEQSEAALTGQTGIRQNVAALNNRINDLAKVAKQGKIENISPAIDEINTNAAVLAKNLKENNVEDAATIKEIAVGLKVLASVSGADFSETPQIKGLYQAVVENQIADLEKATLTETQQQNFDEIKSLYEEQKYIEALEKILLIDINADSNEQLSEQ